MRLCKVCECGNILYYVPKVEECPDPCPKCGRMTQNYEPYREDDPYVQIQYNNIIEKNRGFTRPQQAQQEQIQPEQQQEQIQPEQQQEQIEHQTYSSPLPEQLQKSQQFGSTGPMMEGAPVPSGGFARPTGPANAIPSAPTGVGPSVLNGGFARPSGPVNSKPTAPTGVGATLSNGGFTRSTVSEGVAVPPQPQPVPPQPQPVPQQPQSVPPQPQSTSLQAHSVLQPQSASLFTQKVDGPVAQESTLPAGGFSSFAQMSRGVEKKLKFRFRSNIRGYTIVVPDEECIIGRTEIGAEELAHNNAVSRQHIKVKINVRQRGLIITDISHYGTKINGNPMIKNTNAVIHAGDRVTLYNEDLILEEIEE